MAGRIQARLDELKITLPQASTPAGAYVPFVKSGNLVFLAGQLPMLDGKPAVTGKLGADVSLEDGQKAARLCALNLISQVRACLDGDLDRVVRVVKVNGFVNSTPEFTDQPKVINGCSELMAEVFGPAGQHARAAVSAPSLPLGAAVEIEAIFEVA